MKKKETKDIQFIKQPYYPGGQDAITEFVRKNMKYPEAALKNKKEGTVVLRYDINHKGKVTDAKVLTSLGHGCDEEAIRLIKQLEFIAPKNRKGKVIFHKTIQIHFKLPTPKQVTNSQQANPQPLQINYQVTSNLKENSSKNLHGGSYNYSINIS
jgi:protein TonB